MTIFFCNFAVEFEKRPENSREVAQLVAHYVRDVGVGRSSRLFPTFSNYSGKTKRTSVCLRNVGF